VKLGLKKFNDENARNKMGFTVYEHNSEIPLTTFPVRNYELYTFYPFEQV
jgi:hypothetical protein